MLSVNPNPDQGFYFFDPMRMGLPAPNSQPPSNSPPPATATSAGAGSTSSSVDDLNKKIRKPYTITKSRESWTDQEHDKFLEALQLLLVPPFYTTAYVIKRVDVFYIKGGSMNEKSKAFNDMEVISAIHVRFDRDWKKIEAFVASKTVIQIRSHAQKYFLKVQKSGTSEHVPPPRPKRKASHPYPQKAPKDALVASQVAGPFQSKSALLEPGYAYRMDSSSVLGNPITSAASWSFNTAPPVSVSQVTKDDAVLIGATTAQNCCYTSSNESTHMTWPVGQPVDWGNHGKPTRVMPDFAQVYSFIGSVFDPNVSGHLQRLRQMEPINLETVSLLMRNLSFNLSSPEFEDHRRLLSSYDVGSGSAQLGRTYNNLYAVKSEGTASA